jgi:hypothetical protein
MVSPARLKAGELFPETTVFMIATQDQFISTNNYKKYFFVALWSDAGYGLLIHDVSRSHTTTHPIR